MNATVTSAPIAGQSPRPVLPNPAVLRSAQEVFAPVAGPESGWFSPWGSASQAGRPAGSDDTSLLEVEGDDHSDVEGMQPDSDLANEGDGGDADAPVALLPAGARLWTGDLFI